MKDIALVRKVGTSLVVSITQVINNDGLNWKDGDQVLLETEPVYVENTLLVTHKILKISKI